MKNFSKIVVANWKLNGSQSFSNDYFENIEFDNFSPRCTFSTTRSLANQEVADAIIFHMPNFHWDGCEYHKDKEHPCEMLFWIAVFFMPVLLIPQVQNTKFKKKPSELGVHELWNRHECERKVRNKYSNIDSWQKLKKYSTSMALGRLLNSCKEQQQIIISWFSLSPYNNTVIKKIVR